jgi:hypothetical protein
MVHIQQNMSPGHVKSYCVVGHGVIGYGESTTGHGNESVEIVKFSHDIVYVTYCI